MQDTKRLLRLEDIDALKTLLEEIWALATYGTWKAALDYELPDMEMTDKQLERLGEYWQQVKEFLHGVSRDELMSVFQYLPIAAYGAIYLDLFDDYYKEGGTK